MITEILKYAPIIFCKSISSNCTLLVVLFFVHSLFFSVETDNNHTKCWWVLCFCHKFGKDVFDIKKIYTARFIVDEDSTCIWINNFKYNYVIYLMILFCDQCNIYCWLMYLLHFDVHPIRLSNLAYSYSNNCLHIVSGDGFDKSVVKSAIPPYPEIQPV